GLGKVWVDQGNPLGGLLLQRLVEDILHVVVEVRAGNVPPGHETVAVVQRLPRARHDLAADLAQPGRRLAEYVGDRLLGVVSHGQPPPAASCRRTSARSEEHTSELQ